ncbi:MAG: hypothetical protein AABZ53_08760 [Planctomycetota bacterium]
MTIQELIENAQLDALGLLDERERDDFDRAFRAAPPALQAQLRREQARLCQIDTLLPQGEASPGLFERILAAVRAARGEEATQPVEHEGSARVARTLPMTQATRVHRFWRATAIGFATASIVLSGVFIYLQRTAENKQLAAEREARDSGLVATFHPQFYTEQLFAKDTGRYVLTGVSPQFLGKCAVYTSPQWEGQARLYCQSVPAAKGNSLRIVVLDAAGNIERELSEFNSEGSLETRTFTLGDVDPRRLALVSAPTGQPAVEGVILMRFT